jgi:hypothetical protein
LTPNLVAADAGRRVAEAIRRFHGKDIKIDSSEGRLSVRAEPDIQWLGPLHAELKRIGDLREKSAPAFADLSSIALTIEINEAR